MTIIKEPVSRQKFQNEHHRKSMTSKAYLWCNKNYNHYINQSQHADFLHLLYGWQCSRHIKGYTPSLQSCSVRDAATSVPDYQAENKTMIKFMIPKSGDTIQTSTNRFVCWRGDIGILRSNDDCYWSTALKETIETKKVFRLSAKFEQVKEAWHPSYCGT